MNGFNLKRGIGTIVVSIVKVLVSPGGNSTFGTASLQERIASGRSISRILSRMEKIHPWAIIYLDDTSPCRSGSLPGTIRRRAASCRPKTNSSLLGLAPDGGYLAAHITMCAGGLLHHLFTITWLQRRQAVCFCGPCPAG